MKKFIVVKDFWGYHVWTAAQYEKFVATCQSHDVDPGLTRILTFNGDETADYEMEQEFGHAIKEWMEWSRQTFEKASPATSLLKLRYEIEEVETILNSDGDTEFPDYELPEEYADCIMCLLHSARKAGVDFEAMYASFARKFNANKRRTWKLNPDNTYSHVK